MPKLTPRPVSGPDSEILDSILEKTSQFAGGHGWLPAYSVPVPKQWEHKPGEQQETLVRLRLSLLSAFGYLKCQHVDGHRWYALIEDDEDERTCRVCACTDNHRCTDSVETCGWVDDQDWCTFCERCGLESVSERMPHGERVAR